MTDQSLKNKKIVISAGASGIGWATTKICTSRGAQVFLCDINNKLINKINAALLRIEDGSYGYCDETGEPIGLKRLEARPVATLSLEAQEMHEKAEKRLN